MLAAWILLLWVGSSSSFLSAEGGHAAKEENHTKSTGIRVTDSPRNLGVESLDTESTPIPPDEAYSSKTFQLDSSYFSEMKISNLGDPANIQHILLLTHGDTPRYYDVPFEYGGSPTPSINDDFKTIHEQMTDRGEGVLVLQPMASERDWHDFYKDDSNDPKAKEAAAELMQQIEQILAQLPPDQREQAQVHFHSFSGAGRLDRAFHAIADSSTEKSAEFFKRLSSYTASDAMVNNSFSDHEKLSTAPLASSWARFARSRPTTKVNFISDSSAEYAYMQGLHLETIERSRQTNPVSAPVYTYVKPNEEGELRTHLKEPFEGEGIQKRLKRTAQKIQLSGNVSISFKEGHVNTYLGGQIAEQFLKNSSR